MTVWQSKKSFMLLIALTLVLVTVLGACSGKGNNGSSSSAPASESPSAKQESPQASPAETKKEEPQVPPKVSILLSHANIPYTKAITNWEDNEYVKEIERLSGFDLQVEFLAHQPDFIPQLTTRFASGNLSDLMRTDGIQTAAAPGALEAGAFLELGPLIDQYAPSLRDLIPQSAWDSPKVSKDGKIYGIPAMVEPIAQRVVYIRQDWLDKFGMKAPVTLDDWLAYFEAVKQNDKDAVPFNVRENMAYSDLFFGAFGVYPSDWTLVDGQYVPNIVRPEMKEAIKFWKMLYDKGYVNNNMFTNKAADWGGANSSKAGSWMHDAPNYTISFVNGMVDKTAKLSMLPGPVGPNGEKGMFPKTDGIYFVFVIPTKTENPENALKFLEWAWTNDDAQKFWAFGLKDVNYTETDGKVAWDPANPRNATDLENLVYRLSLNPKGAGSNADRVLSMDPNYEIIKNGIKAAEEAAIVTPSINLPVLSPFAQNPELLPGLGAGTLFLDTFAKIVTGKEDLDASFDAFVVEWKKRGGDKAIQEATEWYNKSVK